MILWDSNYELGIEIIDTQHKELVSIASDLSDLLESPADTDFYSEMIFIISKLRDYTIYHFKTEEDLFEKYGYEHGRDHLKEHIDLVNELQKLDLENIDGDYIEFGKNLLNFILEWIFTHIKGSDFMYRDFIKDKMK